MESELEMSLENQIQDLKDKNNELVNEVQYLKMLAAKKENEKLDLMKEMNVMRLRLSKLRNNDASQMAKMGAAIQSVSEETLSNLVQASSGVARVLEYFKTFEQERQEFTLEFPKWSSTCSVTPTSEKINKVPPMMIGGRSIQPVVSLSRSLQANNYRSSNGTQQTRTVASALPMHMLQDAYIPLTRIDAGDLATNNLDADIDVNSDAEPENLPLDEEEERILENSEIIMESEEYMERLPAVIEDVESAHQPAPRRISVDPLEGPSWLLDRPSSAKKKPKTENLEPDSTTELKESRGSPEPSQSSTANSQRDHLTEPPVSVSCVFSPTIRRKRCASPPLPTTPRVSASPHFSPRPPKHNNDRVLKVLVAKMRLDEALTDVTPSKKAKEDSRMKSKYKDGQRGATAQEQTPKKLMQFDAPSPNGSTDSRVIVLEENIDPEPSPILTCRRRGKHTNSVNRNTTSHSDNVIKRTSRKRNTEESTYYDRNQSNQDVNSDRRSCDSRDSDSSGSEVPSERRARRPRKAVIYKERPLNRKLRR